MIRAIRLIGLLAMAVTFSGCGERNTNSLPSEAGTPEYAKKTGDMMKDLYGAPKAEKATSTSPADMMRQTYGKK